MRYPGGKGGCFRHLVNLMPPHEVYIETHLGGGNILERKKPAARNIGIDVDPEVIATWSHRQEWRGRVELKCVDAVSFLRAYPFKHPPFVDRTLVYADPPYLHSTRVRLDRYRHEYTEAQHIELLGVLVTLPCAVMISGYDSPLYRDTLERSHAWKCVEFQSMTRRGLRLECVWFNFEPPAELHDARYVGDNYRERERIKRKRVRWRRRFEQMSAGERQVVFEALAELNGKNGRAGSRTSNDPPPPRYLSTPENGDTDRTGESADKRSRKVIAQTKCPHTIDAFDERIPG